MATSTPMATSPTGTAAPGAAVAAIHRVVAEAQRLQSDPDGFTDLLTDDVVIVNFGGRRVRGRAAVRTAMEQALASPLAAVITTQEIEAVHFLRSDVALVSCVKHVHDGRDDGAVGSGPPLRERGMLTFVLVEDGGRWRIASAQTTPVAA
jgi:uncharacterized protein (TIGR02246 family)